MGTHFVSYRDIPVGAPKQEPGWIPMVQGTPTNLAQTPTCPACHSPLGWVAGGWYCLNPACPLRQPEQRIVHGL